ncbi:hypothetical protein DPMN_125700 [Dreissena polymorpha]|uniref:Tyr recombinase domain-containing protein n=1 Tax=Dreissena polymorpha TaxID=45954 RepID=A0A9D4GUE9_DREPO|nr:hypothetical protein DPMN_125700 [Dreissena polymorpha]
MTLYPGDSCVNNWMLKAMAKDAGFLKHKRITNHSVRKFLVQKLRNANIPPTETMAITGHKNLISFQYYPKDVIGPWKPRYGAMSNAEHFGKVIKFVGKGLIVNSPLIPCVL